MKLVIAVDVDHDLSCSVQGIPITRSSTGATSQMATKVPEVVEVLDDQSAPSVDEVSTKSNAEKSATMAGGFLKLIGEPQATVPRSSL